jgi:GNAT superfamily N-acetyltransferase
VEVLARLDLGADGVVLRRAGAVDVPAIVELLAADQLGATRDGIDDDADRNAYQRAFAEIDRDPAQLLVVAEADGRVVGTLQLSFLPGLARRGALRAQVEAVRVHADYRGGGLGQAMLTWAIGEARRRGCALVQLTSDKSRTAAHRFYERLGFTASHEGMKLILGNELRIEQARREDLLGRPALRRQALHQPADPLARRDRGAHRVRAAAAWVAQQAPKS